MKTRLLIIIVGLSVVGIFGVVYVENVIENMENQNEEDLMFNPEKLQNILNVCDEKGTDSFGPNLRYSNKTHWIDLKNCEWVKVSHTGISLDNTRNCPDDQTYNEVLFKCVLSCEGGLVYNGYSDSCTTEFELKYHGYCDEGLTYSPSLHVCLGNDSGIQITPLKDPPRTAPPEPENEN